MEDEIERLQARVKNLEHWLRQIEQTLMNDDLEVCVDRALAFVECARISQTQKAPTDPA